jgi:phage-related protein
MPEIAFYRSVYAELEAAADGLRGSCKAHLDRLRGARPGQPSGLRIEKVHERMLELKVSWNRQEWRFLFFHGANHTAFVVHFFQKKTRKTPPREIELALRRRQEIELDRATVVNRTLH